MNDASEHADNGRQVYLLQIENGENKKGKAEELRGKCINVHIMWQAEEKVQMMGK